MQAVTADITGAEWEVILNLQVTAILLFPVAKKKKRKKSNPNLNSVCTWWRAYHLVIFSEQIGRDRVPQDKAIFPLNKAHLFLPAASIPKSTAWADTDNASKAGCPSHRHKNLASKYKQM